MTSVAIQEPDFLTWKQAMEQQNEQKKEPIQELTTRPYLAKNIVREQQTAQKLAEAEKLRLEQYALLSEDQKKVVAYIDQGFSVYVTGNAGTGKSFLLEYLKNHHLPQSGTYVTATTNIAALRIGGETLNRFAGIQLGEDTKEALAKLASDNSWAKLNWLMVKRLAADEISMCDAGVFDKLDYVGRTIRKRPNDVFGGIQLILFGDMLQLPPVDDSKRRRTAKKHLVFKSKAWKAAKLILCVLVTPQRQHEKKFLRMLDEIHVGKVSRKSRKLLRQLKRPLEKQESGIEPTVLHSRRKDVSDENAEKLDALDGETYKYTAKDAGTKYYLKNIDSYVPVPRKLKLKVGAQVMLVKTLDFKIGLVNSLKGFVKSFTTAGLPRVQFENGLTIPIEMQVFESKDKNGNILVGRMQLPLILAYSLTIHKSQGLTIEPLVVDLRNCFTHGQAYVALSRATRLEKLQVLGFDERKITADKEAVQFHKHCIKAQAERHKKEQKEVGTVVNPITITDGKSESTSNTNTDVIMIDDDSDKDSTSESSSSEDESSTEESESDSDEEINTETAKETLCSVAFDHNARVIRIIDEDIYSGCDHLDGQTEKGYENKKEFQFRCQRCQVRAVMEHFEPIPGDSECPKCHCVLEIMGVYENEACSKCDTSVRFHQMMQNGELWAVPESTNKRKQIDSTVPNQNSNNKKQRT